MSGRIWIGWHDGTYYTICGFTTHYTSQEGAIVDIVHVERDYPRQCCFQATCPPTSTRLAFVANTKLMNLST